MKLNRRLYRFEGRVDAAVKIFEDLDRGNHRSRRETYILERVLMQLQIEWEQFVRNLILDSATGRYSDANGRVYSTLRVPTPTREKANHVLVCLYNRQQREPDWYLPHRAIRAANLLAVSNEANISANLGISPWVLDDLRIVRNFVAHRSKQSALAWRQKGLVLSSGRICAVASAYAFAPSGVKNYISWTRFMKLVARKLTS